LIFGAKFIGCGTSQNELRWRNPRLCRSSSCNFSRNVLSALSGIQLVPPTLAVVVAPSSSCFEREQAKPTVKQRLQRVTIQFEIGGGGGVVVLRAA
jgi:hypothetical protein